MFDKTDYIKKELWKDNEYLIDAGTAIKTCLCCESKRYSSEFAGVPEYIDGKFPVCSQCFVGKETSERAAEIVKENLEIRICRKCDTGFPITDFIGKHFNIMEIPGVCRNCTGKK
jgi:hypothetical protein